MSLRADLKRLKEQAAITQNCCISSLSLEDSTVSFRLSLPSSTIRVSAVFNDPDDYPNTGVCLWCEDNEEANLKLSDVQERFDSRAQLETLLSKIAQAFKVPFLSTDGSNAAAVTTAGATSDDGAEDMDEDDASAGASDYDMDDDDDAASLSDGDDVELMMQVATKRSRWKEHEDALVKAEEEEAKSLSSEEAKAKKLQIFDPNEAFLMISNELAAIIRQQDPNFYADSVGNDVYAWDVWMGDFDQRSPLSKDLLELQKKYTYSNVQLRVHFKRGLHPFYPPAIQIIRPHFITPIPGAVSSHPMLKLQNWQPMKALREVFDEIKQFLEEHGRLDVPHPMNDISKFPDASYTNMELQLVRLEALVHEEAACRDRFEALYCARDKRSPSPADEANHSPKRSRTEPAAEPAPPTAAQPSTAQPAAATTAAGAAGARHPKEVIWAKGTGYGYGTKSNSVVWDPKASKAAQEAQDAELQECLSSLAGSIWWHLDGDSSSAAAVEGAAARHRLAPQQAIAALKDSVLVPFLCSQLATASFSDMGSRNKYFKSLLEALEHITRPETQELLTMPVRGRSATLAAALHKLLPSAKRYKTAMSSIADSTAASASAAAAPSSSARPLAAPTAEDVALAEAQETLVLANMVVNMCDRLDKMGVTAAAAAAAVATGQPAAAAPSRPMTRSQSQQRQAQPAAAAQQPQQSYVEVMAPLKVDQLEGLDCHNYQSQASAESVQPRARMLKLTKEVSGLEGDLPLSESSSVFVRIDERNLALWRCLITGPEDTPYSGGCFVFDVYFPPNYPAVPPQVNLRTTGGGTVRFNPNLYNCGKVCLSLLGTWAGDRGESWNPEVSTMLQVLISIQSLILVPEPMYNEPGYESSFNTDEGREQSFAYSLERQVHTVGRAMIDHLMKPPRGFEQVVRLHFKLRRQAILADIDRWLDKCRAKGGKYAQWQRQLEEHRVKLVQLMGQL